MAASIQLLAPSPTLESMRRLRSIPNVHSTKYLLVLLMVLSRFCRCRFSERHLFHCDVLIPICIRP